MLEGSGLLASAMRPYLASGLDVFVYAAGVSNSSCSNPAEFDREARRLDRCLQGQQGVRRFVYFSTCSVQDPAALGSPYVKHKTRMEGLVSEHPAHLIVRLPQLAGRTPNPHTLLNYLYARIARSESFVIWRHAERNILDVDDVARTVAVLLECADLVACTVNVANPVNHSIGEIVRALEWVTGKSAIAEQRDGGSAYRIDISIAEPIMRAAGIHWGENYLSRVIEKYYRVVNP